jgi:hypothetical protein
MNDAVVAIGYVNAASLLNAGRVLDALHFILGMEETSSWAKARLLLRPKLLARLLFAAVRRASQSAAPRTRRR